MGGAYLRLRCLRGKRGGEAQVVSSRFHESVADEWQLLTDALSVRDSGCDGECEVGAREVSDDEQLVELSWLGAWRQG